MHYVFLQSTSSSPMFMKLGLSKYIFDKHSNFKFHENPFSGSRAVPCGRKDGWTHMMHIEHSLLGRHAVTNRKHLLTFTNKHNACYLPVPTALLGSSSTPQLDPEPHIITVPFRTATTARIVPELRADSFVLCVCVYGMCTSVALFKTELRNVVCPQARTMGCLTAGRHVSEPPDVILCHALNPTTKVFSTINNTIHAHSEALAN